MIDLKQTFIEIVDIFEKFCSRMELIPEMNIRNALLSFYDNQDEIFSPRLQLIGLVNNCIIDIRGISSLIQSDPEFVENRLLRCLKICNIVNSVL